MTEQNFEQYVKEAMDGVVNTRQHNHPLYQSTRIERSVIDKDNKRAAFVLFEQIDTDRCTPEGEGWLGDQFRYSVWFMREGEKPKQLYEDHAYMRRTKSALTGSRGRDAHIGLERVLEDGVIAKITPRDAESAYGDLSQIQVKMTLDGKIEEPEDFVEQARNLVKRMGPKLGYDYMRGTERLEGENIAALVWGAENGSTYGYDTVYLVWKDKSGQLRHRTLTDSRSSKDYLSADIKTEGSDILVDVKGRKFRISREDLNLK
jgi:hypothetical protein